MLHTNVLKAVFVDKSVWVIMNNQFWFLRYRWFISCYLFIFLSIQVISTLKFSFLFWIQSSSRLLHINVELEIFLMLWISHLELSQNYPKTNISYPLIRTRTCAYQRVRNVSFSENFGNVLNEWSLINFRDVFRTLSKIYKGAFFGKTFK